MKGSPFHRNYPAALPLGSPLPLHPCRCRAEVREHSYLHPLLWWGDYWNNRLNSSILEYLRDIILAKVRRKSLG